MIIIKKKILLILAVILMGFGTLYRPALADSGWDSDYDSGGSWDSGSDWDSSSSWDSGSDWDSSSSWSSGGSSISGSGGGISLVAVIIVVVIIVVVVSKNGGNKGGGSSNISNSINGSNNISNYKDIDSEKIKSIDKDLNVSEFKTKVFRTYKDIQTAWMNFDTDTIRKLTTDEIYNMYSSQLETLKLKKQRNIMKDIELIDVKIIDIHKENDVITIDAYLNVKYQLPSASLISTQVAVWSTCPCTICPSSRPFIIMLRSTFTLSPTFNNPRLERSNVSFMAVTV